MKKLFIIASATAFSLFAFAQNVVQSKPVKNPKTIKTASGLEYTILYKGNGKKAEKGDKVKVHYTGKLTNDTVFDTSYKRGVPFEFMLGRGRVIKGWDEGIAYLNVGDKAKFKIPSTIGYGDRGMGPIPANATLLFEVELLDATEGVKAFDVKGLDTVKTESGLKIIKLNRKNLGAIPQQGGRATLIYTGYFTDGTIFDTSVDAGKPFSFVLGKQQVIQGWDEGVSMMRKGEKARLIIPYQLAYGEEGYKGVIPPKSTLIFDVELVDCAEPVNAQPFDITGKELKTTTSGLKYIVVEKSTNATKAENGRTVKVHYTGYFDDGKIFDSSIERGEPIEFPLGQGRVIRGWEEGIALMNIGDKYRLIIPYDLAYGENGRPPTIPAKSQLTFDVELIDVK